MVIVTVGTDLAKNVFAVHGVDATGKPALLRPCVLRAKLAELIASLPSCLVDTVACFGAHHWARLFASLGHSCHKAVCRSAVCSMLKHTAGSHAARNTVIKDAIPNALLTIWEVPAGVRRLSTD